MYGIYNSNLLFHASLPLNADGSLKEVDINGHKYSGRQLLHQIGMTMRAAFNDDTPENERTFARDYYWYLWCGPDSPLFDKSKMATFERYFIADTSTHKEEKGYYYKLRDNEDICNSILDAFSVKGSHRHIINGHVPVRISRGENPIKANGKLMVIDGGFAKAYHDTTGIAGYTLVFHSRGFQLVQHEPFTSAEEAIKKRHRHRKHHPDSRTQLKKDARPRHRQRTGTPKSDRRTLRTPIRISPRHNQGTQQDKRLRLLRAKC